MISENKVKSVILDIAAPNTTKSGGVFLNKGDLKEVCFEISKLTKKSSDSKTEEIITRLREKHKLFLKQDRDGGWWFVGFIDFSKEDDESPSENYVVKCTGDDYDVTLQKAIKEALKLVKNK